MESRTHSEREKWQARSLTLANIAYCLMALVFLAFGPILLIFTLLSSGDKFTPTFISVAVTMFAFPFASFVVLVLYLVALAKTITHKLPAERQKILILLIGSIIGSGYIVVNTLSTTNAPMTGANPYWLHAGVMLLIIIIPLGLVYRSYKPIS